MFLNPLFFLEDIQCKLCVAKDYDSLLVNHCAKKRIMKLLQIYQRQEILKNLGKFLVFISLNSGVPDVYLPSVTPKA